MTRQSCKARQALLRGMRPQSISTQTTLTACSSHCVFCQIWSLATIMASRIPLSQKYASSSSHACACPSSPTHVNTYDPLSTSNLLEAQLQTQRARLSSIMSICTVPGAEESEGLHIALDRCSSSIERLFYQEQVLEETIRRSYVGRKTSDRMERRRTDCASSHYTGERRSSRVGITI